MSKWATKAKKIGSRSVAQAYRFWGGLFPNLVPHEIVESFTDTFEKEGIKTLPVSSESPVVDLQSSPHGIREIFDLRQKSKYFLSDCISQHQNGYTSSSYISAYHSTLFSMRAILGLLGIFMISTESGEFLIDTLPHQSGNDSGKKFRRNHAEISNPVQIHSIEGKKFTQSDYIDLFKRFTKKGMYQSDALPNNVIYNISSCGHSLFRYQRNNMIYRSDFIFEENNRYICSQFDLQEKVKEDAVAIISGDAVDESNSISAAIALFWLFERESGKFQLYREIANLTSEFYTNYNVYYNDFLSANFCAMDNQVQISLS